MKKFHHNFILFGLIFLIIWGIVEGLLNKNLKTHVNLKFEEIYNPKVKADLVILGNSHAALGINPLYMNEKKHSIYNFSLGGCNPHYYRIWYNEVFRKNYPKPEYLIYAVDWLMFDSTLADRNFDVDIRLMTMSVFLKVFINEDNVSKKGLILNRFNLTTKTKQLQHIFYKKKNKKLDKYYNGFVPHIMEGNEMGKSPKELAISIRWQKEFDKLLDQIENDSVKIIFVNIPEYIPSWNTEGIEKSFHYLDSVAFKRNIPFLKYNQDLISDINNDSTYFNDWIHLNDKGAEKFSKKLSTDLQKLIK